jgi:hypothetical protein
VTIGDLQGPTSGPMANINSGKEWSAMDLFDLQNGLRLGTPLEEMADFLCRDIDEVRSKEAELVGFDT